MNKWVVYTAAFGDSNQVRVMPQKKFPGIDFICFTDRKRSASGWQQVIVSEPITGDLTRSNRYYKLQPHEMLSQYERSIYIDSNFLVIKLPVDFFTALMNGKQMLVFDHAQNISDPRDCVYEEFEALASLHHQNKIKDDLQVMQRQIESFRVAGYPEHNGLISGAILIRNHHHPDVIGMMNDWWHMIKTQSKRDQLSFNFIAWKRNFEFEYLKGDSRRGNPYFYYAGKGDKNLYYSLLKYKIRTLFK